jgi:ribosome silencing factor RsfS/YbeB/iojap
MKKKEIIKKTNIKEIEAFLDEQKTSNIEVINLTNKSYIANYTIIATALNTKHTIACSDKFKKKFKDKIFKLEFGDTWSIVDLGDVLVHIMTQDAREKYNLEEFLSSL